MPSDTEAALNKFLTEELQSSMRDLPPRGTLCHYSSGDGIRAIISSGILRAYNLGQMNDFSEARYAASVMRARIEHSYAVENNCNADRLLHAMRVQLRTIDLSNVFSLSFTLDGDEPGMWQCYADRGRGFSFAVPTHVAISWARANGGAVSNATMIPISLISFARVRLRKFESYTFVTF